MRYTNTERIKQGLKLTDLGTGRRATAHVDIHIWLTNGVKMGPRHERLENVGEMEVDDGDDDEERIGIWR